MNSPQPTGIHRAFQIFQVSRQASLILTGILLAQSGLSGYDIGQYEMLAYCGYVLSFFWITGLLQGWMIAAPQSSGIQQKRLHWLVGGSLLGLSLLATSLLWLPGEPVSAFFTHQKPLPFVRLYALYLLFSLPAYLTEYLWVLQQKAKWILWYGTGTLALQVMGLMIPIWLGYGLEGGLWGLLAVGNKRFLEAEVLLFYFKATATPLETVSNKPLQKWW